MRARVDVNGLGLRLEVVLRIRLAHPRVELEHRDAFAVDRHLDELFEVQRAHRGAADQPAERLVMHRGLEDVIAIGREDVDLGEAAARADRRAFDVRHLRLRARDLVGDRCRGGAAIADREPADLAGGAQVAFHQRRRQRLRVGDVVEAVADGIGRQERVDVDVDARADRAPRGRTRRGWRAGTAGIRDWGRARRRGRCAPRARRPARSAASPSGRFAPGGGIMPARSLRIIFSVTSPWLAACAASNDASERPPAFDAVVMTGRAGTCLTSAVCSAVVSDSAGVRDGHNRRGWFAAPPVHFVPPACLTARRSSSPVLAARLASSPPGRRQTPTRHSAPRRRAL